MQTIKTSQDLKKVWVWLKGNKGLGFDSERKPESINGNIDASGPMREFFDNITRELESESLPLDDQE